MNELINMEKLIPKNKNKTIKQSKELPRFKYKLGLNEQKLLLCFFNQINDDDDLLEEKEITIDHVVNFCGFPEGGKYKAVKNAIENLANSSIFFMVGENKYASIPWVSYIIYKNGIIRYKLNEALKSQLVRLFENDKTYVGINPSMIPKFNNSYAIRLYLILKGDISSHNNDTSYSAKEIKEMLCLPESYNPEITSGAANIKNKIIEPAIEEINNVSDINIDFKTLKACRRIIGWNFLLSTKAMNVTRPKELPPPQSETTESMEEPDATMPKERYKMFPKQPVDEKDLWREIIDKKIMEATSWTDIRNLITQQIITGNHYYVAKAAVRKRPDLFQPYAEKFQTTFGEPIQLENELFMLEHEPHDGFPDLGV